MEEAKTIDYSIIIPVYYNEESLRGTLQKLKDHVVSANPKKTAEIIFIDDGSGDSSLEVLKTLRTENPELVKIIKLSRNFGQVHARNAGYDYAQGKCVIHLTADLQDPPELINEMLFSFFEENYDIVICTRNAREESFYRRFTSKVFYTLIKKLSFSNMPLGGFDFHLISDRVKKLIRNNVEANPFVQGQILWTGFPPKFIPYTRKAREHGKSRWTFGKKVKLLIDGVLNYSYFPLRMMSLLGIVISICGFIFALKILFTRLLFGTQVDGWAGIMIIVLVLSGIQMLMLGVIGEYLWRALDEVRNRPSYVIDHIYDQTATANNQQNLSFENAKIAIPKADSSV